MSTMNVILFECQDSRHTDKAYEFHRPEDKSSIWIPKSLVDHVSRDPWGTDGFRRCTVAVQEWFALKENL